MKSFVIAMTIFLVLVVSGIAFDFCLNVTSKELLESCEAITEDIKAGNMSNAYDKSAELSEYIDSKKPLLSSILDHSNIDEIEEQISEILGYTEEQDAAKASVAARKLKHMFNHLPENYSLALQNIL
ncbi:MAG: DUF4363 family protein [Clostridia bacterium]|nr:DUF4363 family protein [Clostridia bacterium]